MSIVNGVLVAIPPPEGYVVDFDNPQRNSVLTTYVVATVGMVLAAAFVAQRLYVKAFIRNKLGIDDAVVIVAWLGSIAIQVLTIRSFAVGFMGVHGWEIPFEKFQEFALFGAYINSIVYTVPTCLSKIVILLFLLEINHNNKWYRWSVYTAMFVVAGSSTAIFFSSLFPCQPFQKNYDITFPPDQGTCIDRPAMFQATAALGVVTDIIIILIPVPMVLRLHISQSKKIGLLVLFAIGSATVVTSIIRLALLISALDEVDQTWGGGPIHVWICVEANLLIMCACLSTLRHFIRTVAPWLLSSGRGTSKANTGTTGTYPLQTIGGIPSTKRSDFERLDEQFGSEARVEGGRPSLDTSNSGADDGRSDQGIVQTTTTQVTYANAR
ncbi:hypothetical protein B0T11DRAFT_342368 [Plectosphaerella cucumerina]|uniref:Rhodopsin domain-containing protein n=1 Tax=Plectosphaerella cucumerina TaxID=40658 RepID=A0A8K0T6T5_9PEZI|nr:hypothetical protein B0T11DRAFT_342368 [Plectosphaerella cucumerina]